MYFWKSPYLVDSLDGHSPNLQPKDKEDISMEDKKIVCRDCGKTFVFTVRDQEFYKEKGFTNEPVRCKDCRNARKTSRPSRG